MKMESLAHASIDQLALVRLRLEPCVVQATHQFVMEPAPVERFVYILRGRVCFTLRENIFMPAAGTWSIYPGILPTVLCGWRIRILL